MIATQIAPKGRQMLTADQRACLMSHLTHQRFCLSDREYLRVDAHRRMKALAKDNAKIVVRLVRGWF
jgi:hypothetical protein